MTAEGGGQNKRLWLLLLVAMGLAVLAFVAEGRAMRLGAAIAATTLAVLTIFQRVRIQFDRTRADRADRMAVDLVALDAAPSFITDSHGRVLYRNGAAQKRFGDRDASTLVAAMEDFFASPAAVLFRLQNRANSGTPAREDVVTRHGHSRISAHRCAEDRVLWRLEEFQDRSGAGRGAELLSLPMLTANKAGVVLYSNEAMRRLLGGRPKRLDRIFTGSTQRSGEEVEVSSANGPVRAVLAEIEGAGERREIFLLPVSHREDGQHVLADFEHLPVALAKFAADGLLCAANRAARDILHLAEDWSEAMFHDLFEGLGRPVSDWLADIHAERMHGSTEVLHARNSDGELFFQVTLRRIVEQGRPYVLAVLQDATQLKQLEAQFVQSQKMQAIGQLAGGVAHDFNNLLTAISGHCDLLLLRHAREHPDYADLVQIHQNANRAAALVSQLLAFSRKQTLSPEHLDLQDVLAEATHLLNRLVGERVNLRLIHGEGLGRIRADKRQLEQVVMNLVVNARDAMPKGGTIKVETEALSLKEPMRRDRALVPAGEWAMIRVSDTGTGIPEDRLQKIFEPFYTTKKAGEGTGLGLSTAYGIVKQSGGYIFVDSTVGEGTVFSLYFPIHDSPVEAGDLAPVPVPITNMKPGEGVVLLVEDEAPVRAFASRALRMRGYTVLEAENAEEALKTLEDPTLEVDIFVTDVVMPGMDGPTWVKQALESRPNVKVIFVSGYSEDSLSETRARIPNSIFLPKPFSLVDLTKTVQGQLLH